MAQIVRTTKMGTSVILVTGGLTKSAALEAAAFGVRVIARDGLVDQISVGLFHPTEAEDVNGIALLERAFAMTVAVEPIRHRMHAARVHDIDQAVQQHTINADEAVQLKAAAEAVAAAIAVNDFAPEELASRGASNKGIVPSQATPQANSQSRPAAAE
jgi:hypothetical protein